MPSLRTEVTEIVTGLAMLGLGDVDWALEARPVEISNVTDQHWDRLTAARTDPAHQADFASAWANGLAFLRADAGLRGRAPLQVEWKGPDKLPTMADAPADLRVDHVYLVSCKYLSKVLVNPSPVSLFDGSLGERRPVPVTDWYLTVAPSEYRELYATVRQIVETGDLPADVSMLDGAHRRHLATTLRGSLPPELAEPYRRFAHAVADRSARRWVTALPDLASRERLLWRMLRLSGAPYFVLGSSARASLRLRIDTPWDWRQRYRLRAFEVWGEAAGQPLVRWQASIGDRQTGLDRTVKGHVEVRWSHGRFSGAPEAKVYLDTPHLDVPGYHTLV